MTCFSSPRWRVWGKRSSFADCCSRGWVCSAATLLFGIVHSVTPLYAVIAALIGAYLGALQLATSNLWPPVLAHALYDFVAFVAVAEEWKRRQDQPELMSPSGA